MCIFNLNEFDNPVERLTSEFYVMLSEEFELTANLHGAHMKVTEIKLTWHWSWWAHFEDIYLTHSVLSRWAHGELAVSFPWVSTVTVSPLLPLHAESSDDLINTSQQAHGVNLKFFAVFLFSSLANDKHIQALSQKAHRNLTVWTHLLSSLWSSWVSSLWHNSGEVSVSMGC